MIEVEATVNGLQQTVGVHPETTLLEALREQLMLTGTKEACGVGECGTCVVLIDGEPVTSCLVLAADAHGHTIETVEGLACDDQLSELQHAFITDGALQCGFCTPGMLMTATALMRSQASPAVEDIKEALGGILCRCGAYPKIIEAVIHVGGVGR